MKEPVEFDLTLGKTVANTDRTGLIGNVLLRLHVFIRDEEIEMGRDRTSYSKQAFGNTSVNHFQILFWYERFSFVSLWSYFSKGDVLIYYCRSSLGNVFYSG